jgi:CRP-like cAMP-binding protein
MNQTRLKDVPFFSSMSEQDLAAVAEQTDVISVAAGRVLAREGDLGEEFFVIETGTAEVTRGGAPVAKLGAGDFFGEIALIRGTPDRDRDGHVADGAHRHDGRQLPLPRPLDTRDPRDGVQGARGAAGAGQLGLQRPARRSPRSARVGRVRLTTG